MRSWGILGAFLGILVLYFSPMALTQKQKEYNQTYLRTKKAREKMTGQILDDLAFVGTERGNDPTQNRVDEITESEAISILSGLIRSGVASVKTPEFLQKILDIRASAGAALGPPIPVSDEVTIERLFRIFAAVPPALLLRAWTEWQARGPQTSPDLEMAAALEPDPDPDPLD